MCMIEGCDESFTVYNRPKAAKARKQYTCDECRRDIAVGETYFPASGLFEGHWSVYRTCAHCNVACEWLTENCSGFLHCGVFEDIAEHVHEYRRRSRCIARLARIKVGMERKWKVRRGARKDSLMPLPQLPSKLEPNFHH